MDQTPKPKDTMKVKSKITWMQVGTPFNVDDGLMYPVSVTFADGVTGDAYAKSETPPYSVGDEVEYEITGSTKSGRTKLRVQKPFEKKGGSYDSTGAKVGMALGRAVDLICHNKVALADLEPTARRIVELSNQLEKEFKPATPAPAQGQAQGQNTGAQGQGPAPATQQNLPPNMQPVQGEYRQPPPAGGPVQPDPLDDNIPF